MTTAGANNRTDVLLDALRSAVTFLEDLKSYPIRVEVKLPQEIAALSLTRAARLLKAIVFLLENGDVFAAEPVIRALLEIAFNVAWIGADNDRAVRFRDNGLRRGQIWFETMQDKYGVQFSAETTQFFRNLFQERSQPTGVPFPSTEKRAKEVVLRGKRFAISGMPRAYLAYRRLSGAVHGDFWHLLAFANAPDSAALWIDAGDAVAAVMFVIMAAGETLGLGAETDSIVSKLREAFALSQPQQPPPRLKRPCQLLVFLNAWQAFFRKQVTRAYTLLHDVVSSPECSRAVASAIFAGGNCSQRVRHLGHQNPPSHADSCARVPQ